MNPQVQAKLAELQARIHQVDDHERKGLLRAEQAQAQRAALRRQMMETVIPNVPAPALPMRTRAWGIAAMLVLVGAATAALLAGHAGLRRRSETLLEQGKIAAAQDAQMRRERLERIKRGESLAPDKYGRFAPAASGAASGAASAAVASGSSSSSSKNATADAIAPLLSGRVTLASKFEGKVASDDTLFVTVRTPDDPTGLPLAQIRVEVSNLPFDFNVGTREMIGSTDRFLQADKVIVSARISRSGSGRAKAGDLVGQSAVVQPWANDVRLTIDQEVR
jgi:hypothetical protein